MTEQKKKKTFESLADLPTIPDKLYFTIGEAAKLCELKQYVLRYWEQEFPQLSPTKRRGNRRYYQRKEIVLVRQIKHLLYEQGYTIDGARAKLGEGLAANTSEKAHVLLKETLLGLENLLAELETV
jgi:DNA-binding transcriptional MerR regulator